jgi:ABC-type polysaccharide/polyol phosphate export permease
MAASPMASPAWTASLVPLVRADLRQRYARSRLGGAWAIVAPLGEVAAYVLVFGWLAGPRRGQDPLAFAVLLAAGLLPWSALREALEGSASALVENRWIRRSRVPMELLVARRVALSAVRALVGILLVLGFVLLRGDFPGPAALVLPWLALASQLVSAHGLGLALAPLSALYPDLRVGLASALTLLTFASPILIPEPALPARVLAAMEWNPFTHLLRMYRLPLGLDSGRVAALDVGIVLATPAVLLLLGAAVRRRSFEEARDRL